MVQTFTLDEFCTGAWSDREEYARHDIEFDHLLALHQAKDNYVGWWPCGDGEGPAFYVFLHQKEELSFEFYLYGCSAWDGDNGPYLLQPVMWIYGTTFDGVRESSGGQNFTADLLELAAALQWVHAFACERWPRFREWYA